MLQATAGGAAATTFYVDDDGSGNYTTIQTALNDAVNGDTIIVSPGTYPGDVIITVPDLVLVSSSQYNAVIKATGNAFSLNANNITVKNFNIIGSGSSSGYMGIVDSSSFCTIQNNKISNFNTGIGVYSGNEGGDSTIINNDIFDCSQGVLLWSSNDNTLSGNRISNCETGLDLVDSYGTVIYNNYFNNARNVQFVDVSIWNITKTPGKNVVGGPYVGGNYWATPSGDGFSQTHLDANGDGFAEIPYELNDINIDYLPLVTPRTEPAPSLPVANFQTNVTQGPAPLSVMFTDLSQNAASRNWDFENDGNVDSTGITDTHVYAFPGNYTVNLTAINGNGTASKIATIIVTEASNNNSGTDETEGNDSGDSGSGSGGSSHHSSGGGGVGGSPEPAKNVEVKELSQVFITNGKAVIFDFKKNATCVVYVGFDAIKNAGKTTTIVEQLKNKSALVSDLPAGEVYRSFNVWVGNAGYATSKNIENPVLSFKVEKSWVLDKDIDQGSITLNRYEDKAWVQLPASLIGEDDSYLYFTAETPGFASFAITGKTTLQNKGESVQIPAENRSVDAVQSGGKGTEDAESDENGRSSNTLLSVGIVTGSLIVCGFLLKSMKK